MMHKANRVCKRTGCQQFSTTENGYCNAHARSKFDNLTAAKAAWKKKFYSSWKWRKKSLDFRRRNPFCEQCYPKRVRATLVHHEPEVEQLIEEEKDPLDDRYLHSVCFEHHQAELKRKETKRQAKQNVLNYLMGVLT